jgi:drug/metabolite transporter (DMT)-like permease
MSAIPGFPRRARFILAFAILYFVWGSTYLAIRFAVETIPPFWLAGVRFAIAGAALLLIAQLERPGWPTVGQWRNAIWIGALLFGGGNGLVCWAEQTVPSGLTSLIIATMPLWMTMLDSALFRAPLPGRGVAAGLLLGLIGIFLLVDPLSTGPEKVDVWGAGGLLLACCSWAVGSLHSRHVNLPDSPFVTAGMQMLGGGIVLLIFSALLGDWSRLHWTAVAPRSIASLAYLIVFGSMLGISAYTWLLRNCRPSTVATYAYVNPIIAVVLGAWLGSETLGMGEVMAGGLIVLSVIMIVSRRTGRSGG